MSAKAICTIAVFMHSAVTPLALTIVIVSQDFMEMAYHVKILMNAKVICIIAVFMQTAIILSVLMIVLVFKDSLEMASRVRILMSQVCQDIDEFLHASYKCSLHATCKNTVGSYSCSCNDGFDAYGSSCFDIDECSEGSHLCDSDARCVNNPGSYSCFCRKGYTGNGRLGYCNGK